MIISKVFTKFLHTNASRWAIEKSNLAVLRKKTGYTFANCKKALELHNNDLANAEKWLQEQAKTLGWSKATKLEGRQTTQGLIGVTSSAECAALVEVNCETDFVARNSNFQETVGEVAVACLYFVDGQPRTDGPLTKVGLDTEQLKSLKTEKGENLSDKVALMIGAVGENATLRRSFGVKRNDPSIHIYVYAHPSGISKNQVLLGRVAGLVALRQAVPRCNIDIDELGKSLCQHIVGMNPKKIGSQTDQPAKNADDEECLIFQEFLEDESVTVKEILEDGGLEIIDFKRFECGENTNAADEGTLGVLETCQ